METAPRDEGPAYDEILGQPAFSPNGHRVAFVAKKDGKQHVVVIHLPPSGRAGKRQ